jgi:hypothetical protein
MQSGEFSPADQHQGRGWLLALYIKVVSWSISVKVKVKWKIQAICEHLKPFTPMKISKFFLTMRDVGCSLCGMLAGPISRN